VVITSSCITLAGIVPENKTYSEKDWADINKIENSFYSGYQKSKIMAEKAAWDFYKEHKAKGKCFKLSTVLPCLTFGPILVPTAESSISMILPMFNPTGEKIDNMETVFCDVRDVALAHLRAAQLDEADGHRFIIASNNQYIPMSEIGGILKESGYKIAEFKEAQHFEAKVENSNMRNILKIQPTDLKKSAIDMADSLVKFGIIKA